MRCDDAARLTKALDSLPTLPIIATQLGELIHSHRASIGEVAALISSDPSLSAKLLRLVNSAHFGIPGGVNDIERAIPFVGFNTIYQLALSVTVLEVLHIPDGGVFDPRGMWLHSLAVAAAARVIAESIPHASPGTLFTAGLLHDIGKIALARVMPDAFLAAVAFKHRQGGTTLESEQHAGLPAHDRVGAELARRWRLPVALAMPIENHHSVYDRRARDRMTSPLRVSATVIAVADLVARDVVATTGGDDPDHVPRPLRRELFEHLGIADGRLDGLYSRVMAQLERSRPFLNLLDR